MAIIYSYPLNDNIKLLDELVGTTEQTINGQLKTVTRNFLLADIVEFLIIDGGLQKELILTTEGNSGVSTLDQVTGILNIPHYPGPNDIALLTKETFDFNGSNSFTLLNTINNILQVIVNTTSLHPVAYEYTLPSTVIVLNELYAGDTITIVYNYLEEIMQSPNLQTVTDEGNHTTNDIVLDNTPGEYGDYTVINTLNNFGVFQSFTSPTSVDYQSVYAGSEMSINEIYSPTESIEMFVGQGIIQTAYSNGSDYNAVRISSGSSVNGPSLYIDINDINGQIKIDDLTENITLQFPDKPTGTYTIATTSDVIPFNPSDYDLDEFTNTNADPFAKISDIPIYSDFIQDSITNGVIDKAPTENAVYDALQLKQNSLGYTPVNKAGDTMLGPLILHADPSVALEAATKQYVDNIAGGITFRSPVFTATTEDLNATYNNGASGVGATLTSNVNGFIEIDQESPGVIERVLVWQQTDAIENGIYEVTDTGSLTTPFILTRTADADNSPAGELAFGDYTFVLSGTDNGGRGFICNTATTIIIGTTPISFVQFNTAQVTTPGYGLQDGASPGIIEINTLETQEKITFTTTGTTGAATFIGNALNIPTLPQATTSVSGYLSSTDWNTFNNKQVALVSGTNIKTVGGTSLLGSGDVPLILPIREVGVSGLISNSDNGVVILVTATITLTIPLGLVSAFECSFVTAPSCVLTIALESGVTMINNTGTTMFPQLSFTLKNRTAANTYIATGNL